MGISKSKAKPSEGTPQGPVDRGFAADYFGASPVASALNLPQERDSPENRNQTNMHPPPARVKTGHFYFAGNRTFLLCVDIEGWFGAKEAGLGIGG